MSKLPYILTAVAIDGRVSYVVAIAFDRLDHPSIWQMKPQPCWTEQIGDGERPVIVDARFATRRSAARVRGIRDCCHHARK